MGKDFLTANSANFMNFANLKQISEIYLIGEISGTGSFWFWLDQVRKYYD